MLSWTDSVGLLKNVGAKRQKNLEDMGLSTVGDLLFHLPFRYENWDQRPQTEHLYEDGQWLVYEGELQNFSSRSYGPKRNQTILIAHFNGLQGPIEAVWFSRPHLAKQMKVGQILIFSGRLRLQRGRQIHVEKHAFIRSGLIPSAFKGLQPIYSTTEALAQNTLKGLIGDALDKLIPHLENPFPEEVVQKIGLIPFQQALYGIHRPESEDKIELYRQSLAAFEFFSVLYWSQTSHPYKEKGQAMSGDGYLTQAFRERLPYTLTESQEKVLKEISQDMSSSAQMHRLLQGDVGSGKTSVAVMALLQAVEAGTQGVLLAPTEVLARQHYDKIRKDLIPLGVECRLLTGQIKGKEREKTLMDLAGGEAAIAIGTHALLEDEVDFQNLGLIVIDEQHRFGVRQRQVLVNRHQNPDLLVMTATPIPRSLALTVYGHLDLSVIDELPAGRGQVQTIFMRESKREDMYAFMRKELAKGRQAYVVTPLIESSEKMDLRDAESLYEELSQSVFSEYDVALLHGRMMPKEKEEVMTYFREGKTSILVSTTVIEVGIDVANASLMVIEDAERFGLSQLHQLRGRIGRGKHKSYCILISESENRDALERIQTFVYAKDGFTIAEADLKQRGAGELLGLRQHGQDLFKIADPVMDQKALSQARALSGMIEDLNPAWRHRLQADMARKTFS